MEEYFLVSPTNQHFYGYQIKNPCVDPYSSWAVANYPFAVSGIGALFILYIVFTFMANDKMGLCPSPPLLSEWRATCGC